MEILDFAARKKIKNLPVLNVKINNFYLFSSRYRYAGNDKFLFAIVYPETFSPSFRFW